MTTLKHSILALGLSLGLAMAACSSDNNSDDDNGGKGGSSSGGKGGSNSGGSGGGNADAVTFNADVLPIFKAKCSPCHQKGNAVARISHSMATDYSTVQKISAVCPDKKEGECALIRIKKGEMPQGAGCTGDPSKDKDNSKCLTQDEQDTVQAWIDGGLLEN